MIKTLYPILLLTLLLQGIHLNAQNKNSGPGNPKLEVYYFHPTERCPIDQSIEETTRQLMRTNFAREIKDGTIKFQVLNTDDKANAAIAGKFEMNAQALYLVYKSNGKEVKKDFTEFAFSTCQSNPSKFKSGLKQEILQVIKK